MTLRPIRTEADYEAALDRAASLMTAAPDSPEADELDVLATLIERFEDEHAPIPPPDPIDAILFRLEQTGRTTQDLREILGVRRGRVSEILNRKRRLSLDMIRRLSTALDIPAEVLIQTHPNEPPARTKRPCAATARSTSDPSPLPDLVRAHLRADPRIAPDAADLLGEMFGAAYERVASPVEPEA